MITGASSGVGEQAALQVAARGAHVLLVARRDAELERVAAEITAAGGTASWYECDLTDNDAVDRMVKTVLAEHGVVDMLVNNAGRSIRRSLAYSYDRIHDFERTMAINYLAPVRLTMGLLPAMRAQQFGHVVNVVTWGIQMKAPRFAAYIASKIALDTFGRVAGREAWADNVTFTNIRLDLVRTDMIKATDAYDRVPARSAADAGALVVRALEDRPVSIDTIAGRVGEVANLIAPRLSDAVAATLGRFTPDSEAARGGQSSD